MFVSEIATFTLTSACHVCCEPVDTKPISDDPLLSLMWSSSFAYFLLIDSIVFNKTVNGVDGYR
jgi:hypothetical protein